MNYALKPGRSDVERALTTTVQRQEERKAVTFQGDKTQECIFCGHSQAFGAVLEPCAYKGLTPGAIDNRHRCVARSACDQRCRNRILKSARLR